MSFAADSDPVDGGETLSSKRSTALNAKLSSILSSSYADHSTRDALRLLDAQGLSNTPATRRTLKSNAQRAVIDADARVVDDFGLVAAQLSRVGASLRALTATVDEMRRHVAAARVESAPVLDEAGGLLARRAETQRKENLLRAFTQHFVLGDDEARALTSSALPLDGAFFTHLARLQGVHADISMLFTAETDRLALELMETTTRTLNQAFQKLHNHVNRELGAMNIEDPHLSPLLRRALRTLSERPALFAGALTAFAESRTASLNSAFQVALTGNGGGGGGAKAIEFSTHEPVRYIGDMLAWVHSAAVSEKEALEGLFVGEGDEIARNLEEGRIGRRRGISAGRDYDDKMDDHNDNDDDDEEDDEDEDEEEEKFNPQAALSDLISRNLSLVSQTLSSRIEVSMRSTSNPLNVFKTYNLLDFYRGIFDKLLGPASALSQLIQTLQSRALSHFNETVGEDIVQLIADDEDHVELGNLTAPSYLTTVLATFVDVLKIRGPNVTEAELSGLYNVMLTPVLSTLSTTAASIPAAQRATIFKLNYTSHLHRTLSSLLPTVPMISAPLASATAELATLRAALVASLLSSLSSHSGVADLMLELGAQSASGDPQAWARKHLDDYASRLDAFLASALMDAQDELKGVSDRTLSSAVVVEAVESFCAEFEELEGLIAGLDSMGAGKPESEDGDGVGAGAGAGAGAGERVTLKDLYPRTGAEVRALLS